MLCRLGHITIHFSFIFFLLDFWWDIYTTISPSFSLILKESRFKAPYLIFPCFFFFFFFLFRLVADHEFLLKISIFLSSYPKKQEKQAKVEKIRTKYQSFIRNSNKLFFLIMFCKPSHEVSNFIGNFK